MFPGQIITLFSNLYTVDQVQFVGGQTKVQLTDTSLNAGFGYYSLLDTFTAVQPSQSVGFVGEGAHAEGYQTIAIGASSHAEGYNTFAIGNYSHTEGYLTTADGDYQLVVGKYNIPSTVEGAFIIGNGNLNGSNLLHAAGNTVEITGSLQVTGSIQVTGSLISKNTTILTQVSESLNFVDDAAAATGGVPLGGLYRSGNVICIRIV
jgi:hypothetical protein